jgi:hypothetical protein
VTSGFSFLAEISSAYVPTTSITLVEERSLPDDSHVSHHHNVMINHCKKAASRSIVMLRYVVPEPFLTPTFDGFS